MIEYLCRRCGRTFPRFNSLQTRCGLCSYNSLGKPKKPMKRLGKVGQRWLETRRQWIADNPPAHNGTWPCALNLSPLCLRFVDIDQLQLDHAISRSKRPDLRYVMSNLQPSCAPCNTQKSSA